MMKNTVMEKYKGIFRANHGVLRASKAIQLGIPEYVIYEMARKGKLIKESRGLYRLAETQPLGNPDLIQVSLRIPRGVICLTSALYLYELTTQIPHSVFVALPQAGKKSRLSYPPVQYVFLSERQYQAGIQKLMLDGIEVRLYDPEKTITDCFKFRNRIGIEIAQEALKDYIRRSSSPNIPLLLEYARLNRVEKLIRPYLEVLL
jgi:predicted transcriptional regulator of viral defense system